MTFTRSGKVVASLAVIFGLLSVVLGFIGASGSVQTDVNTGMLINNGIISLLFGLCLGVLTDISVKLDKPEN